MRTVEIAKDDWTRALGAFSHTYEGAMMTLDVFQEPELGFSRVVSRLPLRAVVVEVTSEETTITIAAARLNGEQLSHIIHEPTHVRIERTDAGEDVALDIESTDGVVVMVRPSTLEQ